MAAALMEMAVRWYHLGFLKGGAYPSIDDPWAISIPPYPGQLFRDLARPWPGEVEWSALDLPLEKTTGWKALACPTADTRTTA